MTIKELKNSLIEQINRSDDFETLDLLQTILENKNAELPKLTDWQIKRIEESEQQLARGEYYTEEEANKRVEEWFKRK
jgi:hypothetical protein